MFKSKLTKVSMFLFCVIVVIGTLYIVDAIQRYQREQTVSEHLDISRDIGVVPAYNVEGLTDEEIDRLLEIERDRRN